VLLPAVIVVHLLLPGTIGTLRSSFFPKEGLLAQQSENAGARGSGRVADLGPALDEFSQTPVFGQGYGTRLTGRDKQNAQILDDQWLKTLLETGLVGALAWLWIFSRSIRRLARAAKEDQSEDGLLYVALAASIMAFAIGMVLFDAFAFIQVTFILFILLALGSVALNARDRSAAA
jgi:O-antigen ligase